LLDTFSYFGNDQKFLRVNESQLKLEAVAISTFTQADKDKLNGIETGAQVNVNPDWNSTDPNSKSTILNKPDLGSGSGSGSSSEIPYKSDFIASGSNAFELPLNVYAKNVFINRVSAYSDEWSQTGSTLTITTVENGDKITVTGSESTTVIDIYKQDFVSIGSLEFQLPANTKAKNVFINRIAAYSDEWSQTLDIVTITTAVNGDKITITN
jgi:hypothetical protein